MNEIGLRGGRRKATEEMRSRAAQLEDEARRWRHLADRLDEIESYAIAENSKTEGDGPVPHIGVGSQDEAFLWSLAVSPIR